MLIPASKNLPGVNGATWDVLIKLWADQAATAPFDLSVTYDVTQVALEVDGIATLTPTSGLTVSLGQVQAMLSPTLTANAPDATSWRLKLVRLDGGIDFPVAGTVIWRSP